MISMLTWASCLAPRYGCPNFKCTSRVISSRVTRPHNRHYQFSLLSLCTSIANRPTMVHSLFSWYLFLFIHMSLQGSNAFVSRRAFLIIMSPDLLKHHPHQRRISILKRGTIHGLCTAKWTCRDGVLVSSVIFSCGVHWPSFASLSHGRRPCCNPGHRWRERG